MAQFCPLPRRVSVSALLVECGPVSGSSVYCGVEMWLKTIVILAHILMSLQIPFHIIGGDEPEDRNTIIRLDIGHCPAYYTVTNEGITYVPAFMDGEANKFILTTVMLAVNSAVSTNVQVKE